MPTYPYPIGATPSKFVDHEALQNLCAKIEETDSHKIALIGFGECAKHLINYYGDRIVFVLDDRPPFKGAGITFRGVPCISSDECADVDLVLGCEYSLIYEYMGKVVGEAGLDSQFLSTTSGSKADCPN